MFSLCVSILTIVVDWQEDGIATMDCELTHPLVLDFNWTKGKLPLQPFNLSTDYNHIIFKHHVLMGKLDKV